MNGIIYLIQPAELTGTNRYKIGCSSNSSLKRLKSYREGSQYICISECKEPFILERKIKKIFNDKFKLTAGYEFFEGCLYDMKKVFLETILSHINEYENIQVKQYKEPEKEDVKNSNIHEMSFTCKDCTKSFKSKFSLERHGNSCKKIPFITEFKCEYCTKSFTSKFSLERHSNSCKGKPLITPFKCEYCLKLYARKSTLNTHKEICKEKDDKIRILELQLENEKLKNKINI
jgi:hypothetical protein